MTKISSEKILASIVKAGLFAILVIPFITLDFLIYPSVNGQALIFQFFIEILLVFYIPLVLLYPRYRPNLGSKTTLGILVYFAALFITALFSANREMSFWSSLQRSTGLVLMFHFLAYYFMLVSIFKNSWLWFLRTALAAGAVMAIIVIGQSFHGETRAYGTIGNSDFLGTYLLFFIYFAILLFVKEKSRLVRALLIAVFALIISALVANATRAVFVGLAATVIFYLLIARSALVVASKQIYRATFVLFAFLTVVIILTVLNALPNAIYNRLAILQRIQITSISSNDRIIAWQFGLRALGERPLTGFGPENFSIAFNKGYDSRFGDWLIQGEMVDFDKAHNIIMEILGTSGVIGIAAYAIFVVMLARVFWQYRKTKEMLILGLLFVGYETDLLFSLDTPASLMLFMIMLALIETCNRETRIMPPRKCASAKFTLGCAMFYVLAAPFIMNTVVIKPWLASYFVSQAQEKNVPFETVLKNYQKAIEYKSVYNTDIIRDFAKIVLAKIPYYDQQQEAMYGYLNDQMEKYDNRYDWQKQLQFARLYNILCDKDAKYCAKALDKIGLAEKLAPNRPRIYTEGFVVAYKMHDYRQAQLFIEQAMERGYSPEGITPMLQLIGEAYQKNQELSLAIRYYKKALVITPDDEKIKQTLKTLRIQLQLQQK